MTNPAIRLEQLLRSGEDCYLATRMQAAYAATQGKRVESEWLRIAENGKFLRADLLKIRPMMTLPEIRQALARHIISDEDRANMEESVDGCSPTDIELLGMWTSHSRRIYTLSHDLQAFLSATSLSRISWNDIRFPFDSFAVALTEPIICDVLGGPVAYDTFLVARDSTVTENDELFLHFVGLPQSFDKLQFTTAIERQDISRMMKLKKWRSIWKKAEDISNRMQSADQVINARVTRRLDVTFGNVSDDSGQIIANAGLRHMFRIIAGMCLYFQTLPTKTPHISDWKRGDYIPSDRGACITDESEVCVVTSRYKLTPEEHNVIAKEVDFVMESSPLLLTPHFRTGYWHRPIGRGNDSSYPKTEWTSPTFVNRHLLNDKELPGGADVDLG